MQRKAPLIAVAALAAATTAVSPANAFFHLRSQSVLAKVEAAMSQQQVTPEQAAQLIEIQGMVEVCRTVTEPSQANLELAKQIEAKLKVLAASLEIQTAELDGELAR